MQPRSRSSRAACLGGLLAAATASAAEPPEFSGQRALEHLRVICELGPRPTGSVAMTRQRALLVAHFRKAGAKVTGQAFTIRDPRTGKPVHMENVIVEWHPERKERILVGTTSTPGRFPTVIPSIRGAYSSVPMTGPAA